MDFRVPVTIRASILTAAAQGSELERGPSSRETYRSVDSTRACMMNEHVGWLCDDNWNLRPMKTAAEAFSLHGNPSSHNDQFRGAAAIHARHSP